MKARHSDSFIRIKKNNMADPIAVPLLVPNSSPLVDSSDRFGPAVPSSSYGLVGRRRLGRRRCRLSTCCGLLFLFLGVALFLLLPRSPTMRIASTSFSYDPVSRGATIVQSASFKNSNFYSVVWSKLTSKVYLCEQTLSDAILFGCKDSQGSDASPIAATVYHGGVLGSFKTRPRESTSVTLTYAQKDMSLSLDQASEFLWRKGKGINS